MQNENEELEKMRHSASHLLAAAVLELYPDVKFGIGPAIENGFYYDFDFKSPITDEDLKGIEKKMIEIKNKKYELIGKQVSIKEAKEVFKNQPYKLELIKDLEEAGEKEVGIYTLGDFTDLCRGPHMDNTEKIGAFKLTSLAGAYWKGSEKNKMCTRIYGVAFKTKDELNAYLQMLEEAKKRDHRKLGKELDLFSFHDEGPGFPFWHAKGTILYNNLLDFIRRENYSRGYNEIFTPIILSESLWHTSGHWDHFQENMYFTKIDEKDYAVKPMNCPGGLLIYKNQMHSYRELPLRNAEFGLVHRHELSGVLSGLFRVRAFTQDDAHSFCSEDQIESEIIDMVDYAMKVYSTFGFREYTIYIATKPENAMGSDEVWEMATESLKKALEKKGLEYKIKEGEGAFYGPKIEFNIKDAIGRNWQCGTIQVDFSMPVRFDATYEGSDGEKHHPVMIHRAILGSLERFIGILIEHYAGGFPVWLAPVQAKILPVNDDMLPYAEELKKELEKEDIRVEIDGRAESLGKKIRNAELEKVPYMIVMGEKEKESGKISVRSKKDGDLGSLDPKEFSKKVKEEVKDKR
jgi:threonyl-tRNA synthetase